MALILNIFTANETASIAIMEGEKKLGIETNNDQRDHAAWLQTAIQKLLVSTNLSGKDLDAVAIAEGPGSYTGLRVGMATAKGLCYAWNLPLITESTLKTMAFASISNWSIENKSSNTKQITLFCTMIDARRQDVFSAVYNEDLVEIEAGKAKTLDEHSYSSLLEAHKIIFSGSGSSKFEKMIPNSSAVFQPVETTAYHLGALSYRKHLQSKFADLAYSEPAYLKEFHFTGGKN